VTKRLARPTLILLSATITSCLLVAQGPKERASVADALKTLDHLAEQNRRLEQQNQELVKEINALRQVLLTETRQPRQTPVQEPSRARSSTGTASPKERATEDDPASSSNSPKDAGATLPEATDGVPGLFGEFNPGKGFIVAKGELGTLNLSGYMAARYLNQLPPEQSASDHLGRPITVTPRQDFQFHRVMLFSQGWVFTPKFQYGTFVWTVQDTNQVAVGGSISYNFNRYALVGIGWNAYPGTQSLQGSHPYWQSYDRVMADEFFRPFFSQGVFGQGIIVPRLEYRWMIGNNNSNLDVPATRLDRKLSAGAALSWLPTTGEYGPRGAFGDYERHEKVATKFNVAYTWSPEERQSPLDASASNTTLRLADSLNIFDRDAFGEGVTVTNARYKLLSASAGMKYRGFWLQGEGYYRKLDQFGAVGPMPVKAVHDTGFYVQLAHMVVRNRIELYGATSYVFSDYGRPKEFMAGANYYPWNTRNTRMNLQLTNVDQSPVSSTFGFYTGKMSGTVLAIGATVLY
jgi:hypothetical protein